MKKIELRCRCWIEIEGVKFFGPGPAKLLAGIEETGSISKSARAMGMSYKKAWHIIDDLNARGKTPYVISHKGGQEGGGAELTPAGKKVLATYNKLIARIQTVLEKDAAILNLV